MKKCPCKNACTDTHAKMHEEIHMHKCTKAQMYK